MGLVRGQIYMFDFGPPRGNEKAYLHPGVVLSINQINDRSFIVVVVPGTTKVAMGKERIGDLRVPMSESKLPKETVFEARQITAIDPRKLSRKHVAAVGRLSEVRLTELEAKVRIVLGLQ